MYLYTILNLGTEFLTKIDIPNAISVNYNFAGNIINAPDNLFRYIVYYNNYLYLLGNGATNIGRVSTINPMIDKTGEWLTGISNNSYDAVIKNDNLYVITGNTISHIDINTKTINSNFITGLSTNSRYITKNHSAFYVSNEIDSIIYKISYTPPPIPPIPPISLNDRANLLKIPLYRNNSKVYYKNHSYSSGGTVVNHRKKQRKT